MKRPLPTVPLAASAAFPWHPDRLVAEGRRLGPVWRFRHPVYGLVPVVSDPAAAHEVLGAGLHIAGRQRFEPWLGVNNLLGPGGPSTTPMVNRAVARIIDRAIASCDPQYYLTAALRPLRSQPGDAGPGLRAAALAWLVDAVCQTDAQATRAVLAAAQGWQESTTTLPLLVPALRSALWTRRVGRSRLGLISALARHDLGHVLDGQIGSFVAGGLSCLLGPIADALPMLAMGALSSRLCRYDTRIAQAVSTAHPLPLLILEARKHVELRHAGLELDDEDSWKGWLDGQYIGVDLLGSSLPFGLDPFATTLEQLVDRFARAALTAVWELDLKTIGAPRRGRARLCVGPVQLHMSKWTG